MNNKFSKFLCLLLSGIIFSATMVACKSPEGDSSNTSSSDQTSETPVDKEETEIGKIAKTDKVIVENGKTEYKILLPVNADSEVITASNELKLLLSEATGATFVSTSTYVEGGKYFSLGNTQLAEKAGLSCTYQEVGFSGYKIKTIDDSICIYAYDSTAVIYGVYEYLERMLNFDCYFLDVYSLDKVNTLNLYDFDCVDVPDFENRVSGVAYLSQESTGINRRRMRQEVYYRTFLNNTGYGSWHNSWWAIEPGEWYELHPEWFNDDFKWKNKETGKADDSCSQLCYSAHGNAESLTKMLNVVADRAFTLFMENPSDNELSLNMMDNSNECACAGCTADAEKYGARSATVILFFNRLAELLEEKFEGTNDPRKETFKLSFYAYHAYRDAPVTKTTDANGNIVYDYHPDMKLHERVSPMYAGAMDLPDPVDSEKNVLYYDNMFKWKEISSQMHLWLYDFYFWNQGSMVYFDSLDRYQEHLRLMKASGADWIMFEQHGYTPTSFLSLRQYIANKLAWNVDEDVAALTDKYFKAMYGSKSEEMKQLYIETKALMRRNIQELGLSVYHQHREFDKVEYWPKTILSDRYDRMVALEKSLLASGEKQAADNVKRESMAPLFMLLTLYRNDYAPVVKQSYIQQMTEMHEYFGYNLVGQLVSITGALEEWNRG